MKRILGAALAVLMTTASIGVAKEVKVIDGCEVFRVEGTNYYNLVDPLCQFDSQQFTASSGEDARAERALAAQAAAREAAEAAAGNTAQD